MDNQSYDDCIVKHLQMIECVIDRLAENCFKLKGWAVALVSIVSALAINGDNKGFIVLPIIPLIAFWMLDAYYLKQERKYRILYRHVIEKEEFLCNYSMDTHSIRPNSFEQKKISTIACLFSRVEICFYGGIFMAIVFLLVIMKINS